MLAAVTVDWAQVAQVGVGGAACAALVYVARTLRAANKDVLTFLGNHLSHLAEQMQNSTEATAESAAANQAVADALREMTGEARRAHDNAARRSVET